jgi:multisubunit Na+/H+ antiporter MnhF subunit
MTILLIAAVVCIALALALIYRVIKGPTAMDRLLAVDAIDLLVAIALVLCTLYTGRTIYMDVALVMALLGFVGTVFTARYLEGRL